MLKTGELRRIFKAVDVVLEVVDARLPLASRPACEADLLAGKERILVLNKADLADPWATARWLEFFREQGQVAVEADCRTGKGLSVLEGYLRKLAVLKKKRLSQRGILGVPLRVMVVGIPNVGKSSLLNRLLGRSFLRTGDKPGITRGPQWVRRSDEWEVLDTPGVLGWAQEGKNRVMLQAIGCLPEDSSPEKIAEELMSRLARYDGLREELSGFLERLGRERGLLRAGGEVDTEKAARVFLQEFRRGVLGRFTLEWPPDYALGRDEGSAL